MVKYYSLLFFNFFLLISSQTIIEIEKNIKASPIPISKGKEDEFIKVMNEIIQSSVKIGYPYGIANGYYGKAYVAYIKRDLSSSINFAKLAERENIGTQHSKLKTDIYHLLGQNYANLGISDAALNYYKKMIFSSKTIPDRKTSILNENIAYNDIASIYQLNKNNKDSAYHYMLKVYKSLNDYKDRDDKMNTLLAKATAAVGTFNLKEEKKDSAKYYLEKSLKQIPFQITETSKDPNIFKHLTSIYAAHRQYGRAKEYAEIYTKNTERTKNFADIKDAYKLNYDLSDNLNDGDRYENLKKYAVLNDSLNKIDKNSASKVFEHNLQEKNNRIKEKSKYLTYLQIVILLILIGLGFGIYFLKRYIKKKNSEKKIILNEKQSEIVRLESKINIAFDEVVSLAKKNSPNFLTRFKEVYPDFAEKIIEIYPCVQSSELTFCAYIKLNFSTKDISNFTFVTPKTVQMRKYRLRKKLNIPSDQDMYIWMNDL